MNNCSFLIINQHYAHELEEEKDKLQNTYNKLSEKNKKIEHNFIYRKLGNYLVEDLIYAIENYPDKNVINEYLAVIEELNNWGKQHNGRIIRNEVEHELEDLSIDNINCI